MTEFKEIKEYEDFKHKCMKYVENKLKEKFFDPMLEEIKKELKERNK